MFSLSERTILYDYGNLSRIKLMKNDNNEFQNEFQPFFTSLTLRTNALSGMELFCFEVQKSRGKARSRRMQVKVRFYFLLLEVGGPGDRSLLLAR